MPLPVPGGIEPPGAGGEVVSDPLTELMVRNLSEVFSERDPDRRIEAVRAIYAEDATFYEGKHAFVGWIAISAQVSKLLTTLPPDFVFSPAMPPSRNHDLGRMPWQLGKPGGAVAGRGMDVALFADGKIRALYVFLEDRSG